MDYIKKAIWGPDPKEQQRKIKSIIRKNTRQIERNLRELQQTKAKTEALTRKNAKQGNTKAVKLFAKEMYAVNKQYTRMYTSKATMESIGMKVEESFAMKNLTEKMALSAGIMHEVNSLIRLPAISATVQELEKELMKNGVITEMIDDSMDIMDDEFEDEEVDEEVNKIVEQYTSEKFDKVELPQTQLTVEEPEEVENDAVLDEMRERLKALQA